jgi:hypothetical protein
MHVITEFTNQPKASSLVWGERVARKKLKRLCRTYDRAQRIFHFVRHFIGKHGSAAEQMLSLGKKVSHFS